MQDTNTHYLCRQLTGLGGQVTRTQMLPDEHAVLVAELRTALQREPALLLTTGGLGPTDDDQTLAAVADAVGRPLQLHEEALGQVRRKYEQLAREGEIASAELNDARTKMALLPNGADPVCNPVGAAPAVQLDLPPTTVVCLPGIPAELRGIFEQSLPPLLSALFGSSAYLEESVFVRSNDESALVPLLRELSERHPSIYIKSRAKSFGGEVRMKVMVSARGDDAEALRREIDRVLRALDDLVGTVAEV